MVSVFHSANPFRVMCWDAVFLRLLCPFQICLELVNDITIIGNRAETDRLIKPKPYRTLISKEN